jgi:hypothetical protein
MQGMQTATVRVGYTYKGTIGNPGSFGNYGNGNTITGAQARGGHHLAATLAGSVELLGLQRSGTRWLESERASRL